MNKILRMIHNENIKIYSRTSTWVMMGLLLVMILGVGMVTKFLMPMEETTDWRSATTAENEHFNQLLNDPTVSENQKQYFHEVMTMNEYRLVNDIAPIYEQSVWGFTQNSAALVSIITLFTIVIAASSVLENFLQGLSNFYSFDLSIG
ncbi:hypothetical protein [Alkalihalobacterium alkalinitrilicum]|uniref:hypothetical protein n=1 Tax=Alkalihalobacterium alkalinitrilicum TaxID=427920 RepID=UPI000995AEE1|nr:hypothetical protein [Alkalihalobacterium alkalinitrilicum]